MWWYILISIIIAGILLGLAWRLRWNKWIVFIYCLLEIMSVICGTWHRHFEPLKYQHKYQEQLNTATDVKSKLRTQISKFNHNDNGHFFFVPHQSKSNLADVQYSAINELAHLRKHQPPKLASNYHKDTINRRKDIQSIIRQLKRHRIYFRTIAQEQVIKEESHRH